MVSVLENLDDSPENIILESVLEGMAPTGYDVTPDKTYVIDNIEVEIVKKIFSMYITGNGYGIMAQVLNDSGQRTKLG